MLINEELGGDYVHTRVRENNGIGIINVVVEFDRSVGGFNFKVGDGVSNGESWHFEAVVIKFQTH